MIRFLSAPITLLRRMHNAQRSLAAMVDHKILIPSIEFFLTDTCNLRCNNCSTSSPYMSEANLPDLDSFVESLSFLSRVARCGEIRFLGGEPLLNKNICKFMRAARESGVFRNIRVITNGLLLSRMSEEFWQLADIVRVSVYPATVDLLSAEKLESFEVSASMHRTKLEIIRDTHFMRATSDIRIEDADAVQRIFSGCGEAHGWSCHLLHRNHLYRCSRVHTLDRYLDRLGVEHENFSDLDGLILDGRKSLFKELENYLKSTKPLKACSFCFGTSGPMTEHSQLMVREIQAASKKPISESRSDANATARS